ncbi:MAG: diguanylate cyclase [Anaerolineaceae bacterium]|nr:diguanylate cyclase [Anaerolineaceae bacterium]
MKGMSPKAKVYILSVVCAGIGLLIWNLANLDKQNIWMMLALCILASFSLIIKVIGATERSHFNISFLIYSFTFVVYGLPATVVVILVSNLIDWFWHKYPWYIQSFNIGQYLIAAQVWGWLFYLINPSGGLFDQVAVAAILVALAAFTLLNHLFIGLVVWVARGENFTESGIFSFFPLMLDFTLLSLGAGIAVVWLLNPYAIILSIIPLYLIYSTLRVPALERRSTIDTKTGLFNARYFTQALENELSRANRMDRPLTVVMADLDLLRNINNTYDHLAGDQVLIGIANILRESVRDYDIVSRFGGEEFSILLPETRAHEAYPRMEKIREIVKNTAFSVDTSVTPIRATLSFGIAERSGFGQTDKNIVHQADVALYRAKLTGRNRTVVFSDELEKSVLSGKETEVSHSMDASLEARVEMSEQPFVPGPRSKSPYVPSPQSEPLVVEIPKEAKEVQDESAPIAEPRPKQVWGVNLYIGLLTVVGLGLFAVMFRSVAGFDWIGLAIFAVLVFATEWLSVDIYVRDTSVSTSAAPLLAGVLLFGPVAAVVLSAAFALGTSLKHRSPINRFIFNTSNQLVAGMIYLILISLVGTPFSDLSVFSQVIISLVSALVVYLLTTLFIALAINFNIGAPVAQIWKDQFAWLAPYYLTLGLVAYAFIFSYDIAGWVGVGVILAPLLIVRLSQKQYIDRTKVIVQELRETNIALQNSLLEIRTLNDELLLVLAEVIDMRDPFVLGHSQHVSRYAVLMAEELGLNQEHIELVRKAGLLHDIGKLGIPEKILFKPAKLTSEEYAVIKKHSRYGAEIISKIKALRNIIPIVLHHHEQYSGKGYPDGLKGQAIPIESRIVALSDAVEAMASDRPYRKGSDVQFILKEIRDFAGIQFDPLVVDAFIRVMQKNGESVIVNSAREKQLEMAH